ncbi:MAG: hypothetical protein ACHQ50_00975 [Fimbriimonadales bacterium]
MIAPFLAATVFALCPIQEQKSIYNQVVKQPNPNNGYEDYIRAADLLHGDNFSVYVNWSPNDYEDRLARKREASNQKGDVTGFWSNADEAQLQLSLKIRDLGFLGVQRRIVAEYGRALDLVRAGNQKAVWDPREKQDGAALFPEYAGFRSVAKLFRADAYVRFADGNSKGGTTDLLQGLTFARRIGGNNLISELVSLTCRAIVLASFEEQLPRLSERDAGQIVSYVDAALAEPDSYARALQGDRDFMIAGTEQMFKDPKGWGIGIQEGDPPGVPDYMAKMSPRERDLARAGFARGLTDFFAKILAKLNQDESTWASAKADDDPPPMPAAVNSVQDLVDVLVRTFVPDFDTVTVSELRARAQLRLLGLHARVIDFRWKNNRLPKELKEAVPEKLLLDPMGGEAFHYELTDGGYKLYSKGLPTTGPIELRYRRPANLPVRDDKDIPPEGE